MPDFDWARFEDELYAEFHHALARVGRAQPAREIYAVALHAVYRELDHSLTLPALAAAAVDTGAADDAHGFWGVRWNPPDWEFPEIELRDGPVMQLERALTNEATRGSQAHFGRVEARYFRVLVAVVRRLRDEAPSLIRTSKDFVAFVCDVEGGPALAAKSIPRRRFARLFPGEIRRSADAIERAALDPALRAAYLVTRFSKYDGVTREDAEHELVAMGAAAVPAVLGLVADATEGWMAAKVLGQIGHRSPEVVASLRAQAPSSSWHAMALGVLGDQEWLGTQPPAVAVPGLCARFREITGCRLPLDFAPLERYLDGADPTTVALVEDQLAPGSSHVPVCLADVAEGVRGLASKHAVVRWHATSLLGDRGLGSAAGKVVLPALAGALRDPHPFVRRIAALSIGWWKAAARPYRSHIEALRDDPDPIVKRTVASVLERWP